MSSDKLNTTTPVEGLLIDRTTNNKHIGDECDVKFNGTLMVNDCVQCFVPVKPRTDKIGFVVLVVNHPNGGAWTLENGDDSYKQNPQYFLVDGAVCTKFYGQVKIIPSAQAWLNDSRTIVEKVQIPDYFTPAE